MDRKVGDMYKLELIRGLSLCIDGFSRHCCSVTAGARVIGKVYGDYSTDNIDTQ